MICVTRDQQQIFTTNVASGTVGISGKVALPHGGASTRSAPATGRALWTANARDARYT